MKNMPIRPKNSILNRVKRVFSVDAAMCRNSNFVFFNMKNQKYDSTVAYLQKFSELPKTARSAQTHIAFSMIPILVTNLCHRHNCIPQRDAHINTVLSSFFLSPDMNYFQKQPQTSLHLKIISGKLLKNMMPATVTCGGDITKFLNQFKKIKIPFRADNNGQWGQKPTYFMSKQNKSQPTLFLRVFSPFG